jgi:ferric-dicitrate binding protein FerR (iron transport regulator)
MDNERYLWLVTREITGEITSEEKTELESLLVASPLDQEKFKLTEKFWRQEGYADQSSDSDEALKKILARINENQKEVKSRTVFLPLFRKLAVAAMAIFMVGVGFYSYQEYQDPEAVALIERHNGTGMRSMITLSDGTRIWLNADSKVSYPEMFVGDTREVHLTGEAFFSVAHNTQKPFYIQLNKASIRVVGTSFNVKAYSNEENIQTSVLTGKVAFISRTEKSQSLNDTVYLVKNNKVTYSLSTGKMETGITNAQDDREWINGKLICKSETLESIARQLERNFGKQVVIKDPKVGQYRFTGTFEESSLEEILQYLAMTRSFKYSITEKALVIY